MEFILWIVFGGIIGWVASLIMNTDREQGIGLNVVVGIIGAVIGGWLMNLFGSDQSTVGDFSVYSFLVSLLGAVVLIGIVKAIRK